MLFCFLKDKFGDFFSSTRRSRPHFLKMKLRALLFLAGVVMIYAIPASLPVTSTATAVRSVNGDDCAWSDARLSLSKCVRSVQSLDSNTQCRRAPAYLEFRRYIYFCSETFTANTFNANFTVHSVNNDAYRLHIAYRQGDCDVPLAGHCGISWYSSNWDGTLPRPNARPYPLGKVSGNLVLACFQETTS